VTVRVGGRAGSQGAQVGLLPAGQVGQQPQLLRLMPRSPDQLRPRGGQRSRR
jgi:hypothetical protein